MSEKAERQDTPEEMKRRSDLACEIGTLLILRDDAERQYRELLAEKRKQMKMYDEKIRSLTRHLFPLVTTKVTIDEQKPEQSGQAAVDALDALIESARPELDAMIESVQFCE